MGDRTQRLKGKTNEIAGKAKADAGYSTGSRKTGRCAAVGSCCAAAANGSIIKIIAVRTRMDFLPPRSGRSVTIIGQTRQSTRHAPTKGTGR